MQKGRREQALGPGGLQDPLPERPAPPGSLLLVHGVGHPVDDLWGEAGHQLQRTVQGRPGHVPVAVPDAVQGYLAQRLHSAHREHPDLRLQNVVVFAVCVCV